MKEKRAIQEFLRVNREQWIEKKNERPKARRTPEQRKKELGRQQVNRDSQAHQTNGIANQNRGEERPEIAPRNESRKVEPGITPQYEEGQSRGNQKIRNRQVRDASVINEQGNNHKDGGKFECERQ
jgi:hypothetical protein